jgi:FkbM family methyltransferase
VSGCVLATTEWGPMLVPVFDEYVGQSLLVDGRYSGEEWRSWVPYLSYGDSVVEVGTHCGAFTLAFARAVGHRGRVIGYEAQRGLAMMANGTLALNGLWHAEVRHKAVGASTGVIQMERRDYLRHGNYGGIEGIDEGHGDAVQVTTLEHEAITRCDFLKIDVEGAEYAVLAGAKQLVRRCRPVICCEADRPELNAKVFAWLRQMGYRLYWQTPKLGSVHADINVVNVLAVTEEKPRPAGLMEVGVGETWPDEK